MLWYIIVFLDFYFSKYSQIGWAKILVSCTIFLCCLFILYYYDIKGTKISMIVKILLQEEDVI